MATRFLRLFAARTKPNHLDLPGVDRPFVHDAANVLSGDVDVGDRIVVVGGGLVGAEVAIELAETGKHVTIVEMLSQIMSDCTTNDRVAFGERLEELGVVIHVDHIVTEIPEESIVAVGVTGSLLKLAVDSVVMAVGNAPDRELVEELLQAPGHNVYENGDSIRPGKIFDANYSRNRTALGVKAGVSADPKEV